MYNFFEKSESRLVAHTQDVESLSSRSEMVPTQPSAGKRSRFCHLGPMNVCKAEHERVGINKLLTWCSTATCPGTWTREAIGIS